MRKYGLPYKGNKSAIADFVIANIPSAESLVDIFCGGCAITHAAMLSGKFEKIIANDIHEDVPRLFVNAIQGKYTTKNEQRWISREDFFKLKNKDAYVRLCWSFGNDCSTYMYAKEIEPFKKMIHEIVFSESPTETMKKLRKLLIAIDGEESSRSQTRLVSMERLHSLQSLQSLQSLETPCELVVSGVDYRDVSIPDNSVIYCDPPYKCTTNNYGVRFDHKAFLDWACLQTVPVIISEYEISDKRFVEFNKTLKTQLSAGAKHQKQVMEKLYCPTEQYEMIREMILCQPSDADRFSRHMPR